MRRALSLAVALVAVSAVPAQAHDSLTAARLGAEVQVALRKAGIQPASPVLGRVSGRRTLRLAIMPIQLPGATLPTTAELTAAVANLNALYAGATGAKLKATAVIAPPYTTTATIDPYDGNRELEKTIASAVAHGVKLAGATPVFIAASDTPSSSYGGPALGALLFGPHWKMPSVWAHEIGHWQGLSHGRSPRCPTPGSIVGCDERDNIANEYGDYFDIMGSGADRFGLYQLRVLGLYTPPEAAAGAAGAVATVAPPGQPGPAGLRLRAASRDWYIEARSASHQDFFDFSGNVIPVEQALPVGGVIVSGAERRYTTDQTGYFPNPYRYFPAIGTPCDGAAAECGASEVFSPGSSLTVPGAFRLDVLGPAGTGASQVKTTWLDKTPPVIRSIKARIEKPWGSSSSTMTVDLVGAADGAGIASVEVKAGSKTTKVDADALTDLIAGKGRATVRIKAPRSGIVRTTLVDAAGHRSAVKSLRVSRIKTTRPNTVTYAPRGGGGYYTSVAVPAGTRVTVSVRMDPKLAGIPVYASFFGPGGLTTKSAKVSRSGRATVRLALPRAVGLQFVVQLPRKKGKRVSWVQQPTVYYTVG